MHFSTVVKWNEDRMDTPMFNALACPTVHGVLHENMNSDDVMTIQWLPDAEESTSTPNPTGDSSILDLSHLL